MIKVGDWVKREHADGIARINSIEEDMAVLYTGGVQSCEYLEELTKLPIKFKGFEIYIGGCYARRTVDGITYVFTTDQEEARTSAYVYEVKKRMYPTKRVMFKKYLEQLQHEDFRTIDQAKDWLELQYATMLAKAREIL